MKTILIMLLLFPILATSRTLGGNAAIGGNLAYGASLPITVPAYVQYTTTNNGSTSLTTAIAVITNNSGNFMFAVAVWASSSTTGSITDSKGNTWTKIGSQLAWNSANAQFAIFYATNIASGSNSIKLTFSSSSTYGGLGVCEYSGVQLYKPLDQQVNATGTSSSTSYTCTTGSATTTQNGELIFSLAEAQTGPFSVKGGSGYTARLPASDENWLADQVQSGAGSTTATAVDAANSDPYAIWLATFFHK